MNCIQAIFAAVVATAAAGCMPDDYPGDPISTDICPSGLVWGHGDEGSSKMYPGSDCNSCHIEEGEGPVYAGAGTVYRFANEGYDCFGVPNAWVSLQFADGKTISAPSNEAGNFYFFNEQGPFQMPFRPIVDYGGRREVSDELHRNMNCNACHRPNTEASRVMIP